MKKNKVLLLTLIIVLLSSSLVMANDMNNWLGGNSKQNKEKVRETHINWQDYTLEATGYSVAPSGMSSERAKLLAREGAIAVAQRNLVAKIKGLNINSTTKVKKAVTKEDTITRRVNGFLKGGEIIEEKALGEKTYQVTMQVRILGKDGVAKYLFPQGPKDINRNSKDNYEKWSEKDTEKLPDYKNETTNKKHSSIIINVTTNDIETALYPKVLSQGYANRDSKLLYGIDNLEKNSFNKGIVSYEKSLAGAKSSQRAGEKPYVINVDKTTGDFNTDIVLNSEQTNNFLKVGKNNNIFKENKIIIVTNK